jgi:nitrogen fixation/metabolism regulation signal transduction histidine kinase
MSEFEHLTQPAESQLQQAMGGVASIIEGMLRRSREIGTQLADARERQRLETDHLAAMERDLHADRATLEQMSMVFARAAGRPEQSAVTEAVTPRAEAPIATAAVDRAPAPTARPWPIETAAPSASQADAGRDRASVIPATSTPTLQELLELRSQ